MFVKSVKVFILSVLVVFAASKAHSQVVADTTKITVKILCYNLRFGELASLRELAEFIESQNPDVVALQEVDVKTYRERAPGQNGKDFITELGYRTGMLSAFARTIDYAGGYYGIGILSKYPYSQTRKIMLPMPPGAKEQRAVLIANIELPGDKSFVFASTHLDHSSSDVRMEQVKVLNENLGKNSLPVIVAGDFNAKPLSPEIEKGMSGWRMACPEGFTIPADTPKSKIDYIFYSPEKKWRVLNSSVPNVKLSDHLPVTAEMELIF